MVLFSLSFTLILFLKFVSYHSLSHHIFSHDNYNQRYKSGNISQLHKIIHSTQSCTSDVKGWMTNNQLQLNNDKTEIILIATKTVLNSDSVPQSINLEGSDIKLTNTVRNLGVCLDSTLSLCNSKSPPFVVSAIWNFVGLVQNATICPKMSPKKKKRKKKKKKKQKQNKPTTKQQQQQNKQKTTTVVCVCSFKTRLLELTFGGLSLVSSF